MTDANRECEDHGEFHRDTERNDFQVTFDEVLVAVSAGKPFVQRPKGVRPNRLAFETVGLNSISCDLSNLGSQAKADTNQPHPTTTAT